MNSAPSRSLRVAIERWPIAGAFTISRGAKTEAQVVVVELNDGRHRGRGECVPYARYDETVAGVMAALGAIGDKLAFGLDRNALQNAMPAGAYSRRSKVDTTSLPWPHRSIATFRRFSPHENVCQSSARVCPGRCVGVFVLHRNQTGRDFRVAVRLRPCDSVSEGS